ncbi:hypothetical protein DFS34DRAFT_513002 [Phlyctochytrium arcticum]|nr:hypothetical protein DFS34DRAFT_513002 [Phlyctochytrium arcticum]
MERSQITHPKSGQQGSKNVSLLRSRWCGQHCLVDAKLRAVYTVLDQAKDNYLNDLAARRAQAPARQSLLDPLTISMTATKNAKDRILKGFFAEGKPNSTGRVQQVDFLWKIQYPDLMIHLERPVTESAFKDWAMSRREKVSYYASSLASVPTASGIITAGE